MHTKPDFHADGTADTTICLYIRVEKRFDVENLTKTIITLTRPITDTTPTPCFILTIKIPKRRNALDQ